MCMCVSELSTSESQCRVVCIQKQKQKTKGEERVEAGRSHQLINEATDLHFPPNKYEKKETPGLLVSSSTLSQKLVVPFFVCGRWVIITKRFLPLRQSITKRVLPSSRYVIDPPPPLSCQPVSLDKSQYAHSLSQSHWRPFNNANNRH